MRRQAGFFDVVDRLKRLSDLGDQLEAFEAAVEFEAFRPELNAALTYSDGTQGGRPPFDPVMMFKILVIQPTNSLSDERAEFLINDRLSFMRFLGFGLSDRVPDARAIWLFREKLTKAGAIGPLFERFDATLRQSGYIAMSGQIVYASLTAAPRQRNKTRGQNWALGFDYPLAGVTAFCGVGQCFFGHMTRTCCPHLDKEYPFLPPIALQMKPCRSRAPTGDTRFSPLPSGFRH